MSSVTQVKFGLWEKVASGLALDRVVRDSSSKEVMGMNGYGSSLSWCVIDKVLIFLVLIAHFARLILIHFWVSYNLTN